MERSDSCDIYCYDKEKVTRVQQKIKNEDINSIAKLFKVLADEKRAKIVFSLSQEGELCVCDVANIIESSVATASHHLRILRRMGLAKYRKEGKLAFYSLVDDHVSNLIILASVHQKEVASSV